MMPFCCNGGGGDQDRLSVRDVTTIVSPCGGPLGAAGNSRTVIQSVHTVAAGTYRSE